MSALGIKLLGIRKPPGPHHQKQPKKARQRQGRPPLDWTSSRERKLVRFKLDLDFEWKYIPAALAEPGFTPQLSACQAQWKELTNTKASEIQSKDPVKKQLKREKAIRAFEQYQKDHGFLDPSTDQAPVLPPIEHDAQNNPFKALYNAFRSPGFPAAESTPSEVPDLSQGGTPLEPITETETPENEGPDSDPIQFIHQLDIIEPYTPTNLEYQQIGGKRARPPDDDQYDSHHIVSKARLNTSNPPEETTVQTSPIYPRGTSMNRILNERQTVRASTGSTLPIREGRRRAEEENDLPPGIIDHWRKRLSISAYSAVSALSSARSSVLSRRSPRSSRQIFQQSPQHSSQLAQFSLSQEEIPPPDHDKQGPQYAVRTSPGGHPLVDPFEVLKTGGTNHIQIAERLQGLINEGSLDINARDSRNDLNSPLHVALHYENIQALKVLLEGKAAVDVPNFFGETPLHTAVCLGNFPACELLLKHGANRYARTFRGNDVSNHGKIAEREAGHHDTTLYTQIRLCRNLIRHHHPHGRVRTAATTDRDYPVQRTTHKLQLQHFEGNANNDDGAMNRRDGVPEPSRSNSNSFTKAPGSMPKEDFTQQEGFQDVRRKFRNRETSFVSPNIVMTSTNKPASPETYSLSSSHTNSLIRNDSVRQQTQPSVGIPAQLLRADRFFKPLPEWPSPSSQDEDSVFDHGDEQLPIQTTSEAAHPQAYPILNSEEQIGRRAQIPGAVISQQRLATETQLLSTDPPHSSSNYLAGYIERLPTGDWALVCPLTNDASLQYARHANETSSLASVQITSAPAMDIFPTAPYTSIDEIMTSGSPSFTIPSNHRGSMAFNHL